MITLTDYIRDVEDFPTEGILFKDITPLLGNPEARKTMLKKLLEQCENKEIDVVVGIESRGFLFGIPLAEALNASFVPLRKKGKLPYKTISQSYGLEYGTDELEIHIDAIKEGDRVLIHDDLLATGGTAKAACKLIEKLGGTVVQCNFLIGLDFLKGDEKLNGYEVASVLHY